VLQHTKVHKCAIALNDSILQAKLKPGDMIALEAKYHHKCLVNLYNRARALDRATQDKHGEADLHGIAFAELVAHMEDLWKENIAPVFKLQTLHRCTRIDFNNLVLLLKATYVHS